MTQQPSQVPKQLKTNDIKAITATLKDNDIIITDLQSIEELATRGYGTKENGKLTLSYYEALYLQNKEIIKVEHAKTKKPLAFQQILDLYKSTDPNAWAKYLIYRDLRSRGYVAREGFGLGIDFRMYDRGEYGTATAKYLILGIQEGQPVTIESLAQTLKTAHSQKKELVLAVLNRRGEVVHYSLSQLTFKKKQLPQE